MAQGEKQENKNLIKHSVCYLAFKRMFDIFASLLALIVLFPLFAVVAFKIKKQDGGPVFFKQVRVGKDFKKFEIIKFRTMRVGAENLEECLDEEALAKYKSEYKLFQDPRITKFGHKLRATSIDELPQLINILKGEMSFTGPRPILEDEMNTYYPDTKEKLVSMKPGLTGYWQAYERNLVTYESGVRQQMEMYYIENAGFWFDIKILFKTVATVLKQNGAI